MDVTKDSADTTPVEGNGEEEHEIERSAHAIYGLIIVTSTLVADRVIAEDAVTSLLVLWGAAFVLVLAHVYSAMVAEVGERGRWLTHAERHVLILDNAPLLAAVIVPSALLVAAALGWIELAIALDLAIILSIGALFAVGVYQARRQGASLHLQLALGGIGGLIGVLIILLEVFLAH
jgi:hypothetical protein